jgi:hypothetical protein
MNEYIKEIQIPSEVEPKPDEQDAEYPDVTPYLARLGLLGLPDETYRGTSQSLLEQFEPTSDS